MSALEMPMLQNRNFWIPEPSQMEQSPWWDSGCYSIPEFRYVFLQMVGAPYSFKTVFSAKV